MGDQTYEIRGDELPIGQYSYKEFRDMATLFHNYPAPGLMLGGYMVEAAKALMADDVLYEVLAETPWCLPDAAQMLTPCTIGNGWLKVVNLGRYAVSLYDKYTGEGVRVSVCPKKLEEYGEFKTWLYKLKPKPEQDTPLLQRQIAMAGASVCNVERITVTKRTMKKRSKGGIIDCPVCGEPYPEFHGAICRACQGETPYVQSLTKTTPIEVPEAIKSVPIEEAVGEEALHDMTRIEPGKSKGPAFKKGHTFEVGDLCRLQRIGKNSVYVAEGDVGEEWVHENDCARSFAAAMCGENVAAKAEPSEGKVEIVSTAAGMLVVDARRLEAFNHVPGVMAASRKGFSLVSDDVSVAGTRAIPLYLQRTDFENAMRVLEDGPVFSVQPLRVAKAGVLITGNEVFDGLIQDRFEGIIEAKLASLGSKIGKTIICPDDRERIAAAANSLVDDGCDLIITTAGLSVDPDDVTRLGLLDAGLTDILHGAPILPGAMTLLGKIRDVQTLGVPACALFHKHTSLDLLLPRLLAGLDVTRTDLARIGNGGMCMECTHCSFPKCPFGK
ncbi:FmdE family protein [uncultured Pseudodesulfovibrio sp.]|uniref:FmdE family protein n=1 Tax=uncultured Pseudodesulfovibrio sp. TaxID=2035858 RepID=UPI0029C741A4|nr:FmdE family protein [uncultured Pseudodesulfovibrio sp.]